MKSMNINVNTFRQFCTFRIAKRLFGIKVTDVKELHPMVNFTPVFHATQDILGFVNIRGQVHLIINLRKLLGFEGKAMDDLNLLLMLKPFRGECFGILVDCIEDMVKTNQDNIEILEKTDHTINDGSLQNFSDLVSGICKLESELLMILDAERLIMKIEEKHKIASNDPD